MRKRSSRLRWKSCRRSGLESHAPELGDPPIQGRIALAWCIAQFVTESRELDGHFKSDLSSAINAITSDEAEGCAMPLTKLKSLARKRIHKGQLPPVASSQMWGGKGEGARCAVCDKTINA